ncbi:MAG: S41 family peptidase [Vicingaceae bacterium]
MKKTFNKYLLILSIVFSSVFTLAFVDNYFEISKNLDVFATLFRELNIHYVDEIDPGDLIKTGIDAMLEKLDPYTTYIPESKMEDYRIMTTGQYGGIGAVIQQQGDYVVITEPYENYGAFKAGLIAGDKIIEIDGKDVKGYTSSDVRELLLGQPGTSVKIKVERYGEETPIVKEVIRSKVKINDVPYYGMVNDHVGYILLTGFTETASAEFKKAVLDLKSQGAQKIIFDLRGNGGGLLREAVNIVNVFVPKGQEIVSTRGKIVERNNINIALNNPVDTAIPVVVLIDGNSASASEIVSGALQDLDRAVVMGTPSFGKGLVQEARPLTYGAKLKLTIAKYYIPSGRCIQKLDYAHKNKDGKASTVPDSLIKEFKTLKYKRPVFDGKGITPDIKIEKDDLSDIAISLITKNLIFDYATIFKHKNLTIPPIEEFTITDEVYKDFINFLSDKDYSYKTESEELIEKFEETAKKEKYLDDVKEEYIALKEKVFHNKKEDLIKFKDEIKMLLENEIIGRYYYQKGQIKATLKHDKLLKEAIKVAEDSSTYNSILKGTYKQN